MTGNLSIFNIGDHTEDINKQMYQEAAGTDTFDIRVKNVGDTASFVIRPVPYIHDIMGKSKVMKHFYVVPDGPNYLYYDSRTTFNRPADRHYEHCPISDIWKRLDKAVDPAVKGLAERLRRQTRVYMYVYIVNCPSDTSLNGRIMPMQVPVEMEKAMKIMANPSEDQIALGKKAVQALDLVNGSNLTCTIKGHKPFADQPLMRDWTVQVDAPSPISLPVGENGAMLPITQADQGAVEAFFKEQQTIDLWDRFGYTEPSQDVQIKAFNWVVGVAGHVPGMLPIIEASFGMQANPQAQAAPAKTVSVPTSDPLATQVQDPMATQPADQTPPAQTPPATETPNVAEGTNKVTFTPPAQETTEDGDVQVP